NLVWDFLKERSTKHSLTLGEQSILSGNRFYLNDSGTIQSGQANYPLFSRFQFLVHLFSRLDDLEPRKIASTAEWSKVREYFRIRNRVVHPGPNCDMDISDVELELTRQ